MQFNPIYGKDSDDAYRNILGAALNPDIEPAGYYADRMFLNNVLVQTDRPSIPDLGLVGFGDRRWRTFIKDYTDSSFLPFLNQAATLKEGQELGYQTPVNGKHDFGNCLMGVSIATAPAEVTLFSRACIYTPTGLLDISFGSLIAQHMGLLTGKQFTLNWYVRHMQICSMRMAPLISAWGWEDKLFETDKNLLIRNGYRKYQKILFSPTNWTEAGFMTKRRIYKQWAKVTDGHTDPYHPQLIPVLEAIHGS